MRNSDSQLAVEQEAVRKAFYAGYATEGESSQQQQEARKKAFRRSLDAAQKTAVMARVLDTGKTMLWPEPIRARIVAIQARASLISSVVISATLSVTGREFANAALEALELGWQVAVDLKSDADFDKRRCGPDHECFPVSH